MALVAWYKLNGNVLDSSINKNNGVVSNATVSFDGPLGSCYTFGDNCYIKTTNSLYINGDISFLARIYPTNFTEADALHGIVSNHNHNIPSNFTFFLRNGKLSANMGYTDGTRGAGIESSTLLSLNVWTNVGFTYNHEKKRCRLYINGILDKELILVKTVAFSEFPFIIGEWASSYLDNYEFRGNLSDIRVYDHELSKKEVIEYNKCKVLHYDFNQFQEPTVNLLPTPTTWVSWTLSSTCSISSEYLYKDYNYGKILNINADGAITTVFARDLVYVSGTQVTYFSFWARKISGEGNTIYVDPDGYRDSSTRQSPDVSPGGKTFNITTEWQKYSFAINTNDPAGTFVYIYFYHTSYRNINYQVALPQYELKDHATPFVNGTREAKVYDKSGYNNNAELAVSTTPTYINESIVNNGCYEFDGIDDFIQVPVLNINNNNKFTISFWCYCADTGVRDVFFGNYSLSNNFNIERTTSNTLRFWYTTGSVDITIPAFTLPSLEWINITIVYSSTGFKAYKNGVLIYENQTLNLTANVWANIQYIGRDTRTGTTTFKGKIADFRIYSTALSEDDIKEIYQTRASIDKNGNLYCNSISNGDMIWDSEINSINLVTNGSAELENNTNFTSFNYITTDSYDGTGCLSRTGNGTLYSNEYIKIDKYNGSYYLSGYFKSAGSSGLSSKLYYGIACFDYLKRLINPDMVCHYTNTETTLAQPLNNGDTIVYLTSASNWHTSASSNSTRKIGVYYNEINIYPKYTYTRSTTYYTEADLINNTITLTSAWTGGSIPAGAYVSNNYDSGTYQYISASYASVPFTWTKYINSTAVSGWGINNSYSYFRYGTEYIKLLFLSNYGQDSTYTTLMDNLKFWNTKAENKAVNINIEKTSNIVATEFSEVGITEGLVAYYPLNGDAKDYSGNNNHGTIYGAIKASGIAGKKCYYFDGTDDYIQLPSDLGYTTAFTACAWFKSLGTPAGGYHIIFGGQELEISIPTAGSLRIGLNTSIRYVNNYGSGLTDGNWHHVCMTFDGTKKKGYIDGILVGEASVTGTLMNSFNRTIGRWGTDTSYYTNGLIQDVRIYNRALTNKEIEILYNLFNPNINKTLQINKENIIYTKGSIKEV